jgi:hypothetical protein
VAPERGDPPRSRSAPTPPKSDAPQAVLSGATIRVAGAVLVVAAIVAALWNGRVGADPPARTDGEIAATESRSDPASAKQPPAGGDGPSDRVAKPLLAPEPEVAPSASTALPKLDPSIAHALTFVVRTFDQRRAALEPRTTESGFVYLEYLEADLSWRMEKGALETLERGECYAMPSSASGVMPHDLFAGQPFMGYTGPVDNGPSWVAVPVGDGPAIMALRRSILELREVLVSEYIVAFNAKPDAERASLRASCAGKGLHYEFPGLPYHVSSLVAWRMSWSATGNYIAIKAN